MMAEKNRAGMEVVKKMVKKIVGMDVAGMEVVKKMVKKMVGMDVAGIDVAEKMAGVYGV